MNSIYIIAEAGVNHNGELALAKTLVAEAKAAGADCVKFQTFKAERVVTAVAPKARYQMEVTDPQESQLQMLQKLELSLDAHKELIDYCRQLRIDFLSTPYSEEDIPFLEGVGVPAYKVASGQLVELDFLRAVAHTGKPIYLSTGMATLAEVDEAVRAIRSSGHNQLVLLQCTTNYPSRVEDANLRAIPTMAAAFDCPVGYSDHTQSNTACLVSIGLGARVIEKHLTLDNAMLGPDHAASADPNAFRQLVIAIREAEKALGSGCKEPTDVEVENAKGMRRSLVATRAIKVGEIFAPEMLTCKRPGTGLRPSLLAEVLGRRAICEVAENQLLDWSMLGERA